MAYDWGWNEGTKQRERTLFDDALNELTVDELTAWAELPDEQRMIYRLACEGDETIEVIADHLMQLMEYHLPERQSWIDMYDSTGYAAERTEYKGHELIKVSDVIGRHGLQFGLTKARAVCEHAASIQAFVSMEGDLPDDSACEVRTYKGTPVLDVPLPRDKTFSFGPAKAVAITQHMEDIQAFVAEHDGPQDNEAAPLGGVTVAIPTALALPARTNPSPYDPGFEVWMRKTRRSNRQADARRKLGRHLVGFGVLVTPAPVSQETLFELPPEELALRSQSVDAGKMRPLAEVGDKLPGLGTRDIEPATRQIWSKQGAAPGGRCGDDRDNMTTTFPLPDWAHGASIVAPCAHESDAFDEALALLPPHEALALDMLDSETREAWRAHLLTAGLSTDEMTRWLQGQVRGMDEAAGRYSTTPSPWGPSCRTF